MAGLEACLAVAQTMSSTLVDSHCHLDLLRPESLEQGVEGVLQRAADADVRHMLCVAIDLENAPRLRELAMRHGEVSCSAGVHPNERIETEPDEADIVVHADHPAVVAVGETGLDYFRSEGDLEWQRERFRRHIRVARALSKPLIIHCRDAATDTLRILREERAIEVGGVMHCFVEDWDTARGAMDLGFAISFSGIVTFRNATELREVAKRVPSDRLLVETDSPYLAPVPHRGKANEPAYVRHVAECVAGLRGEEVEHVAETTTRNFFSMFPLAGTGA